jgi:excinuclease UvrABC nuclease subunit
VGPRTAQKLLTALGSLAAVRAASEEALAQQVGKAVAAKIRAAYGATQPERDSGSK